MPQDTGGNSGSRERSPSAGSSPIGFDPGRECHGLDTPERVCFYEQDFYVLSNFSAFRVLWKGLTFDTSEAAYHWEKFPGDFGLQTRIRTAPSAHEAFKIAEEFKARRRPDWDTAKVSVMDEILRAKLNQHEYVRRKLLATGDRELVENSWRDDVWGWGPNRDGQNLLGKLWMEIRAELASVGRNGNRQDRATGLGPKDEHAVGATSAETPTLSPIAPVQDDDAELIANLRNFGGWARKKFPSDSRTALQAADRIERLNRLGNQSVGGEGRG